MPSAFDSVFAQLRDLLKQHSGTLTVADDSPTRYCLQGGQHPTHKTPMPIAWVQIGKAYVSYHLMPVYASPARRESMSTALQGRMQGKSCFNFQTTDTALFAELDRLTARGIKDFANAGYLPASATRCRSDKKTKRAASR